MPREAQHALDVEKIRAEFPILARETRPGVRLIYLDSAATSQKPQSVIEAISAFYRTRNANIHRGIHRLAEEATESFEDAREKVAAFVRARSTREIIFTRNATEAINLVAHSWGRSQLLPDDLILLTEMEHHSNLVPWQMLSQERRVQLDFVPVTADGHLDMTAYRRLLELGPRLVSVTHMSNVLGTINPISQIIEMAHSAGALVLVDAAQSVPHMAVDTAALDADFLVFSSHKMCGPTGVGVLYGKEALLEKMPPFLGGGDMIKRVRLREFVPNELPHKFEAGTPPIAEAVGLGAAVDFLRATGMEAIHQHEQDLVGYAMERLEEVPGVHIFGPKRQERGGLVAFAFDGVHPHDIAQLLDHEGIAVRAGHHCAMPIHEKFGLVATTRASFYLYNIPEDVDKLVEGLYKVKEVFG